MDSDTNSGVIYVLTNPFMPGLVKIGCTTGLVEDRMKDLAAATGVPVAFQCHFAAKVSNMAMKEKTLHQLFGDVRVNQRREFFKIGPEKVVLAIQMGDFQEVTPGKVVLPIEEEQAFEEAEANEHKRRARISLAAIGILPGMTLTFSRDDSITATVQTDNKVTFNGQLLSLSKAALQALQLKGSKNVTAASGSDYWMLGGKTLDEIRIEKEEGPANTPDEE